MTENYTTHLHNLTKTHPVNKTTGQGPRYCNEHSILETWWNHEFTYKDKKLKVRAGEYWLEKKPKEQGEEKQEETDDDFHHTIRGKRGIITPSDVEEKMFLRDVDGTLLQVAVYTWLEDENGNVYDVNRRCWNNNGDFNVDCYTAIEGKSKQMLAMTYGAHYDPIPVKTTEKYVLEVLKDIYGPTFLEMKKAMATNQI